MTTVSSAIAVPAAPSVIAHQPTALLGGPGLVPRMEVAAGRVLGEGVQTRHPQMVISPAMPPVHTYQDVNTVKPQLFLPRPSDTCVTLLEEHHEAVSAVDGRRVADGIAANSKWTADMRAVHQHCMQSARLMGASPAS
eukprot:TRINITY_DN15769_c0_g1_i1.p2 TRINITY_DN15769_c0_g1~~TRINITY_DN15769_c0_g1_i1.p2  ORF type:complete len:157 (+),score=43.99 TRINITY_DN15769_c0_g1_i1:60-473(+)